MREQLIQYVNLLFAGTRGTEDIKQEILQNTLDRYDDLVSQGKQPEAAYSLAISGIGDISEILGSAKPAEPELHTENPIKPDQRSTPAWKKVIRAMAVGLYIICAIPLIILSELGMDVIGLCATISIVAVATVAIIIASDGKEKKAKQSEAPRTPQQELRAAVRKIINTVVLVIYFVISFTTGAWYITWLVFPIEAAVWGLVKACMDLKEADQHEN